MTIDRDTADDAAANTIVSAAATAPVANARGGSVQRERSVA